MNLDKSTLSLEESLASLIVWLASEVPVQTSATCGLNSDGSWKQLNHDGSWLKTCRGFSQVTLGGFSAPSSLTWGRFGIAADGQCTGLVMWARRIKGTAFSSSDAGHLPTMWPTPVVPNGGRSPKGGMSLTGQTQDGRKRQVDLAYVVRHWPTLRARDCQTEGTAAGARHYQKHSSMMLASAVTLWATPTASPWRSGKASEATAQRNSRPLSEQAADQSGLLNPEWVEMMMGFPIGWTDLTVDGQLLPESHSMNGSPPVPLPEASPIAING